jgi:6-phosphogluconolactonase
MRSVRLWVVAGWLAVEAAAATFYCDPVRGSLTGDGSAEHPWPDLEATLAAGRLRLPRADGTPRHPEAPCGPGDTLLLRSGWHGMLRLSGGYNDRPLTIAAAPGCAPQVGGIEIREGARWVLRGLTVSPSLAPTPPDHAPRNLAILGERGGPETRDLVLEDCFLYTTLDTASWTARDWVERTASGIWLGRRGRGHVARNNYLLNVRFGIQLCAPGCVAEGNVVENFSADGIRVTRDDQIVRFNVIKNSLVSGRAGDRNHDDGIQAFLFNRGHGTLRRVVVEGNLILETETGDRPFPGSLQGIGFFDGPLVGFLVRDNVVGVSAYHGISLYDARKCVIERNTCCRRGGGGHDPWIMLGGKYPAPSGNVVRDNRAPRFLLRNDPDVRAENNREVTPELFAERQARLAKRIADRFGAVHPVARRPRLRAPAKTEPAAAAPAARRFIACIGTYTGSGSRGIYAFRFDADTGRAEPLGCVAEVEQPSFLAPHPNGRFLYAVGETARVRGTRGGSLSAFRIDRATGRLTLLNQVSLGGPGPCHLAVDATGRLLAAASYAGGNVVALPIGADGRLAPPSAFIQHEGSSINPRRQLAPHAHCVTFSPDNRFLLVADLGTDRVMIYRVDPAAGTLTPNDPPSAVVPAGSGPRHLAFHPNGRWVYVIHELNSTLETFAWDAARGALEPRDIVSTLPTGFTGKNSGAEVAVHPNGRFVYGSNRGHDSIARFAVRANGTLKPLGTTPCGGRHPRNFALDPTGRFLWSANRDTDNIALFRVNPRTGALTPTGQSLKVPKPVCVVFLPVDGR